jgi:hypothetical protein
MVMTGTPDGRHLLLQAATPDSPPAAQSTDLWRVSRAGGQPRKVDLKLRFGGPTQTRCNPRTGQLAITAIESRREVCTCRSNRSAACRFPASSPARRVHAARRRPRGTGSCPTRPSHRSHRSAAKRVGGVTPRAAAQADRFAARRCVKWTVPDVCRMEPTLTILAVTIRIVANPLSNVLQSSSRSAPPNRSSRSS